MAKKQKNFKKQSKSSKKIFSFRKLDFKKNWKKLSYLGLAGFLALSSVGYGVWKNYVQDEASAAFMDSVTYYEGAKKVTKTFCGYKSTGGYTVQSYITVSNSNTTTYYYHPIINAYNTVTGTLNYGNLKNGTIYRSTTVKFLPYFYNSGSNFSIPMKNCYSGSRSY